MAYKKIFPGAAYNRMTNPNLLPLDAWVGLRSEVQTNLAGHVVIRFYTDIGKSGNWSLALAAIDDGKTFGGAAIAQQGYAGIRTDFMDVEFDNYSLTSISQ